MKIDTHGQDHETTIGSDRVKVTAGDDGYYLAVAIDRPGLFAQGLSGREALDRLERTLMYASAPGAT